MAEIEAAGVRLDREHNDRAWQAWHTAYLPRSEQPVALKKLLTGAAANAVEPPEFLKMRLSASNKGLRSISMADYLKSKG